MRLCVTLVFLTALTWTRADPVPTPTSKTVPKSEECHEFEVLTDKKVILGRFHFLVGYANNTFSKTMLGATSSLWATLVETETGLKITEFQKMNGTCVESRVNMTFSGDTAKALMYGLETELQLLNFTTNAIMIDLKVSSSNITNILRKLHLDPKVYLDHPDDLSLNGHNFYLIGKEPNVSEDELKQFKVHAECAGFTGEPHFLHKKDQEYCTEEGSVLLD